MAVIAIVEERALLRDTFAVLLRTAGEDVEGCFAGVEELLASRSSRPVEVAMLGLTRTGEGVSTRPLERLHGERPELHVVAVAEAVTAEELQVLFAAGARAVLDPHRSDAAEALATLRSAARGETSVSSSSRALENGLREAAPIRTHAGELDGLSPRELEVLARLAVGWDNLKIAALLGIRERTVKTHVSGLYRKLMAENRLELALIARRHGLHLRAEAEAPGTR